MHDRIGELQALRPLITKSNLLLGEKNDNFTIRNRRAQDTGDILPAGGAGESAQCPHAPVTMHYNTCGRCRDALPGHYLCCSGLTDRLPPGAQGGGASLPSGWKRILVQGHPRPPPSHARAAILLQCHIKGNHGMISQSSHPTILLTARRKARQQGNIDGLVD